MRYLLAALVFTCACAVPPGPGEAAGAAQPIVGGAIDEGDPEVFQVLVALDGGEPTPFCTATLIGRRTLVTAAHCVDLVPADLGANTLAFSATNHTRSREAAESERFAVETIGLPSTWDVETLTDDFALLLLDRAPSIAPKAWNAESLGPAAIGETVRLVGYGVSAVGSEDDGVRRETSLQLTSIEARALAMEGSGPCYGDTGGPVLLAYPDGTERVIGIFYGAMENCEAPVASRIDVQADFVGTWFATHDIEPSCEADGVCVAECPQPDPDCGGQGGSGGSGGAGGDDPGAGGSSTGRSGGGGDSGGCSSAGGASGVALPLLAICTALLPPTLRRRQTPSEETHR